MDCTNLRSLTKVTDAQLQSYINCMEAPGAGIPEQVFNAPGLLLSIIVMAFAGSQLIAASKPAWIVTLLAMLIAGAGGVICSVGWI